MFTMVNCCKQIGNLLKKGVVMTKVAKMGKPHAVRFLKRIDSKLIKFCKEQDINESDVIQYAVGCFLQDKRCLGRKRFFEHR